MPENVPPGRGRWSRVARHGGGSGGVILLALVLSGAGCGLPRGPGIAPSEPGCRWADRVDGGTAEVEVEWVVPADDRPVLDLWCSAVGRAAVRPMPLAAVGAEVDSIAIVSWNTHAGGGDVIGLVGDLRAGALTGGAPVRHFVLLLQEVHRAGVEVPARAPVRGVPARVEAHPPSGERLDILETARALGTSLVYVPSMRNGRASPSEEREDRGNAILSTLPLHEPRAIELPFEAQRRVAVVASLRVTRFDDATWQLLVSSTHLDTRSTGGRLLDTFGAGRLRQARALVDAIPAEVPAVIAGDLNTWSLAGLEGTLPFLRSGFPQTPCPQAEPTFTTWWGLRRTLDHIFFRLPAGWSARHERIDDRYGSDHFPLLAWLRIGPPGVPMGDAPGVAVAGCA